MSVAIRESVAEAPTKVGNRWRVIVAKPGQGSSGFYSEDVFRRDAHKIIAPGGQAFINHDDSRNPKDMLGTYPDGSFWSEDDKAVVSELEVFSHWKAFVEEVGPHCGISLYAMGEADDDGNVTSFVEDRLNGADLVARPGLVGSGLAEKLYESAVKQAVEEPSAASVQENDTKGLTMEKDVEERFNALETLIQGLAESKQSEAKAEVEAEVIGEAVKSGVAAFAERSKAITEADILKSQKDALIERASKGEDTTESLAEAIKIATEARETFGGDRITETATRDLGAKKYESAIDLGKVFG